MKRLLAWLEPLSFRERGRGAGSGSHDGLASIVPSPGASRSRYARVRFAPHLPKGERNSRLRRIRLALCVAAVAFAIALGPTSAFAIDPLPFQSTAQRERFQHLTSELRCMVCQDESLLASNADFAKQLRRKIFGMMQEGKSDAEIKDYLVARYSSFILYDPPLAPSTIALWFGTPVILLVGAGVVVMLLRRRTSPAASIPEEPGEDW